MTTAQWGATGEDGGTPIGGVPNHRRWTLNVTTGGPVDTLGGHSQVNGLADTPVNGDTRTGGHLALRDTRKSQGAFLFSSANLDHGKLIYPMESSRV